MKISDIHKIIDCLDSLGDFAENNTDSDESGIKAEMFDKIKVATKILDDEKFKSYLKSAKAKLKKKIL